MAKRNKLREFMEQKSPVKPQLVALRNLKEATYSVPVLNNDGTTSDLVLRIQGRGGQKPPVIRRSQISPKIQQLVAKGFIKLVEVKGE